MEKINNTQWDIAEAISIKSKDKLVQEVVYDELVRKRTKQLNAIRDGLAYIGLLPWLQEATTIAGINIQIRQRDSPKKFLEKCFMKILAESEMDDLQRISMRWLIEYVTEASSERTEDLLVFITAKRTIPPWNLEKPIILKFLADDETKMLPEATTCFYILSIPVVHTSKMLFFKYMDMALRFESNGFAAEGD